MSECWICDRGSVPVCKECVGMLYNGAASADKERDNIVAWLTAKTVAYGEQPRLGDLIDAIERGEHRKVKP